MSRNAFRTFASRLVGLFVQDAAAHCDTEDGPAVTDALRALEAGNVNIALKWVQPQDEDEVRAAFDRAARAGDDASRQAYLETLIRVHRAAEGAGFDGIKPPGAGVTPQVAAADEALAQGSIDPLRGLIEDDRWGELERRFDRALSLRTFDPDDLVAARLFMEAYVSFFTFAEGHDEDHHGHGHAHDGHRTHAHESHAH